MTSVYISPKSAHAASGRRGCDHDIPSASRGAIESYSRYIWGSATHILVPRGASSPAEQRINVSGTEFQHGAVELQHRSAPKNAKSPPATKSAQVVQRSQEGAQTISMVQSPQVE